MIRYSKDEMPQQPLVVVASLFVLGGALGWVVELYLWQLVVALLVLFGLFIYSRTWWSALCVVLFAGITTTSIWRVGEGDVVGAGLYKIVAVNETEADIVARRDEAGEWCSCFSGVRYRIYDEGLTLERGDEVVAYCNVKYYNGRNYCVLSDKSIYDIKRAERGKSWSVQFNEWCWQRIAALSLSSDTESLCQAMLLVRRAELSEEVTQNYRRSGAAHLLAVSGLHVMIICFVVGRLLYILYLLPLGFRLRPLVVAGVVWCYAAIVGMTPSVERAAIMFIVMQLLSFFGRRYMTLLGLSIAVMIMTLIDPRLYFDIGFMLSVAAVVAIVVWAVPLDRKVRVWCRVHLDGCGIFRLLLQNLISVMVVGAACSVATMPLVSWVFGYISPLGVLLNPLVVVTTYLILMFSLLWVLFGFTAVEIPFRFVIDSLVRLQNGAVELMSSGWRDAIDIHLDGLSVLLIYILYIVVTIVVKNRLFSKKNTLNNSKLNI